MEKIGLDDTRPDRLLKFEDAELIAAEYNKVAVANEEAAFDIFPRPLPSDEVKAQLPLRPPVVTIMGHVDHGKTTLLDTLRSTSVAQGEAGGITQHIGAFTVPVARPQGQVTSVTFLDTPGHAAFSMMRSRGTSVTDMVVLVVAADDSVMPQTREVIQLIRNDERQLPLVVAITKIDVSNADPQKVRYDLMAEGIEVEDLGGDVPCVEISAKKKVGLDTLDETLAVLAEMAELRAETTGPAEGRILESRVEKGRGNVATVLVQRGVLQAGDVVICGTTWAKVKQLLQPDGKATKKVLPGFSAQVAGWRELPQAGDEFLGAPDEAQCKRALDNRKRAKEEQALLVDAEQIDMERRRKAEADALREQEEQLERRRLGRLQRAEAEGTLDAEAMAEEVRQERLASASAVSTGPERKELCVILKGDVSGTVEALAGAIGSIGNAEAGVKIVSQSVGDVTESDVNTAHAVGAQVIGFNVQASKSIQTMAARVQPPVPVHCDNVIYRLMDHVSERVAALLPPREEMRVLGEAHIAQIFEIKQGKGKATKNIAGCRVTNGLINRANEVRVLRGEDRREVFRGKLDALRQVKKDVVEMRKGTECGMSFDGFNDLKVDDVVQCFTTVEVPQTL
ncbi:translation initiation factor IF-2 [Malassezia pachydermatis]